MMQPSAVTATGETPRPPRLRLDYVEGLRGLTALYVVYHHAYMDLRYRDGGVGIPASLLKLFKFLDFGHYAVDIFIVLSGYCLMLPIVASADFKLRGGLRAYIARRARRILPPYYAALALSIAAIPALNAVSLIGSQARGGAVAVVTPAVLAAHLLLLHNVIPGAVLFSNPPLWSVATEWQIYFLFPLLLIIWRRTGFAAAVVIAFAIGLAPHLLAPHLLDRAYPWYIGLFAFGMLGAWINFASESISQWLRDNLPWGLFTAALFGGLALGGVRFSGWYASHRWIADPLFGLATLCLLVYCTEESRRLEGRRLLFRLFDQATCRHLGAFSYSLYLIHFPIVTLLGLICSRAIPEGGMRAAALLTLCGPLCLSAAYLFYRVCERPFLVSVGSRSRREAVLDRKIDSETVSDPVRPGR